MAILAGVYGPTGMEYPDGRHAIGIYVPVFNAGTDDLATLYVNAQKTGLAPNPVTTDALGNLTFFAVPGNYELEFDPDLDRIPVYVGLNGNEPVADIEPMSYQHTQSIPASEWDCPYPLGFKPSGIVVLVSGNGHTLVPISYGDGRIFVHHGAPCTGTVEMS